MDVLVAAAAAAAAPVDYHRSTLKERHFMLALYEDGQSISAISRKLHFHRSTVRHWIDKIQNVIGEEWKNIDKELMRTLAHSMPARCQAVIDAKGWHTKY